MEDVGNSFDVVVGLPYCGMNGGLVVINRDDKNDEILSDWKLIFPFDDYNVWKASVPSLSNVDLPSFPSSIKNFGYRIIPSPDFNDDGLDDLWVVSLLNESISSQSYPIEEGDRKVVEFLFRKFT